MHAIADSRSGAGRGGVRNRGKGSKKAQAEKYFAKKGGNATSKGKGGDAGKGKQGKGHGKSHGKGYGKGCEGDGNGKGYGKGKGKDKGSQPMNRDDRALDANLN